MSKHKKFISEHDCPINHSGSTGSMEFSGFVKYFPSLIQNEKLR